MLFTHLPHCSLIATKGVNCMKAASSNYLVKGTFQPFSILSLRSYWTQKRSIFQKRIVNIEAAEADRACSVMARASKTLHAAVSFMQLDSFDKTDLLRMDKTFLQSHRRHSTAVFRG